MRSLRSFHSSSGVRLFLFGWLAGVVILSMSPLHGQAALSTLRGTATDQSQAVIPGVEVVLTEISTNIRIRTAITADNGYFEMPDLRPGTYRLTAELAGFKTLVANNVVLEGGQIRRLDVALEVGEITDNVTVEGGSAVITTDSSSIVGRVDGERYKDHPQVTFYPGEAWFLATLPGVSGSGWAVRISGQGSAQISKSDDGVQNDRTGSQMSNMNYYSEVTVTTVNNNADQSRVASYNTISKRGENDFHGEVFYKHNNSALNARAFFQPRKPVTKIHEWVGELAGPIKRNKTFFYFNWYGQSYPGGNFIRSSVATKKMRQGDFSQFPNLTLKDPLTGQQFPGNVIPQTRINQLSAKVQQLYIPEPNLGGADTLTNNLGFLWPWTSDKFKNTSHMTRVDHTFSENHSVFGRFMQSYVPYVLSRGLPDFGWTRYRRYSKGVGEYTYVHSSAVVNTVRFGWSGNYMIDGQTIDGFKPRNGDEAVKQIGLQGVNPRGLSAQGFPRFDVTGLTSLETIPGGIREKGTDWAIDDSVTWAFGRHVFKFGGVYNRYDDFSGLIPEGTYGTFAFTGRFSGNPYADFLLGIPHSSSRLDPLTDRTRNAAEVGLFVMDSFKLNPSLTLDYGLRWDYFVSPNFQDGLQYNWNPANNQVIVSPESVSKISPLYPKTISVVSGDPVPKPRRTNFRPRVGFAYRWEAKSVLRGGYGSFTERLDPFARLQGGGPFQISETYLNEVTGGTALFTFPNPFPSSLAAATVPSQSISGFPTETRNGAIHQFNLSLERDIAGLGFRLSYIGSRSRGLNYGLNINKPQPSLIPFTAARRPFSQFVNATVERNDGQSNYNAMQFEVLRKVGAVVFNAHYTYASNLHNFLILQNPYDVTNHWSRDAEDRRHRLVVTSRLELPWGRGRRFLSDAPRALDAVVGGWRLHTISYLGSGQFFSPAFSGPDPSNTGTFGGLPDRTADGNLPESQRRVEKWFDPAAFRVPPAGRFGNSGVNILEGQSQNVHHLGFVKRVGLTERVGMTVTLAGANIFNHPNFTGMRNNISAASPGQYTSTIGVHSESLQERTFEAKIRFDF
ncbi:MAG: carboxypeptidase-like regulatory domain-containing protein [Acidobacteriota bacterium]